MLRRTKIVATMGPAAADAGTVKALVEAGMDVARLNFSHGDHNSHLWMMRWLRQAAAEAGRSIAVLQDIQGPKTRVGRFAGERWNWTPGKRFGWSPRGGRGGRA